MSAGMLLLGMVMGGLVAAAALIPFFERPLANTVPRGAARQQRALDVLRAEQQRMQRAIRDLEFDYDLGKLADDVYTDQRDYLVRLEGAIARRLDELDADVTAQDARIEAAVAALRQEPGGSGS